MLLAVPIVAPTVYVIYNLFYWAQGSNIHTRQSNGSVSIINLTFKKIYKNRVILINLNKINRISSKRLLRIRKSRGYLKVITKNKHNLGVKLKNKKYK